MTKLLIAGDTHANKAHVHQLCVAAQQAGCAAIIQVGDWGFTWPGYQTSHLLFKLNKALESYEMDMYFLDGNHDNFGDLQGRGFWGAKELCRFADAPRVTYIPRGHVWEWDGVTFMALGGAFSIDQDRRTEGKSWWPEELITYADLEYCASQLDQHPKIDVFLSHDCPEGVKRLESYLELTSKEFGIDYKLDQASRANRRALWLVVERAKPTLLLHGHYHFWYSDSVRWCNHTMQVQGLACDNMKGSWAVIDTEDWRAPQEETSRIHLPGSRVEPEVPGDFPAP